MDVKLFALKEQNVRLSACCHRRGIPYQQPTPLSPWSSEEPVPTAACYAMAATIAAVANLFFAQQLETGREGLGHHLTTIEMPWVTVNAQVEWAGVRIDRDRARQVRAACDRHVARLTTELELEGIGDFRSEADLVKYFQKAGLLHLFTHSDGYRFDGDHLKPLRGRHHVVDRLYIIRRISSMLSDSILDPGVVASDGRVHPIQQQLGAHTGRQTTVNPNILGLPGILRPIVIPADGYAIGEVDLSQIEVGIAAAVYGDPQLIAMFNEGDVYIAMVKHFYRSVLPDTAQNLGIAAFKKEYKSYRERMKTCTLAIIYGSTAHGMARQLGISVAEAQKLLDEFLAMFPALIAAKKHLAATGALRGYTMTVTGLRRRRGRTGTADRWERNWMTNHSVQGSACAAFKLAGIRLAKLYQQYGGRIILPFHDAYVFECPIEHLQAVADLTARIMCEAVQVMFPCLRPRVDVNIQHPDCWNKDGEADSWSKWLEDPMILVPKNSNHHAKGPTIR